MAYETPLTIFEVMRDISNNKVCATLDSKRIRMGYYTNRNFI